MADAFIIDLYCVCMYDAFKIPGSIERFKIRNGGGVDWYAGEFDVLTDEHALQLMYEHDESHKLK